MKLKITSLLLLFFVSSIALAQMGMGPVGHLTIFSEDGDKFQLYLNGELQNDVPQTNIRIEDLPQPYYNAKVVFADKSLMEITKNNLMIADVDGIYSDVTYKIRRDKNKAGKMKMNFFSMIPVQQGYIPPSNVYVVHYGAPREVVVAQTPGRVSQTTTTTTTQTNGTSIGVGVNVEGVSMGISINDNMGGGAVTQTTTTTTTHSGSHDGHDHHDAPRGCNGQYCMSGSDFSKALSAVKGQGFDETRLKVAKQVVSANCMNVNQIKQIASEFGFEETKLDFAKFAYDYCVDPRNYFNLNSIFSFSSSVDDLTDYTSSRN